MTPDREAEIRSYLAGVTRSHGAGPWPVARDAMADLLAALDEARQERDAARRTHDEHTRLLCDAHEAAIEKVRAELLGEGQRADINEMLYRSAEGDMSEQRARAEQAERSLAEERALCASTAAEGRERGEALLALQAAAAAVCHALDEGPRLDALRAAINATPAALAGQVRARHLREAADACEDAEHHPLWSPDAVKMLRELADEAEARR